MPRRAAAFGANWIQVNVRRAHLFERGAQQPQLTTFRLRANACLAYFARDERNRPGVQTLGRVWLIHNRHRRRWHDAGRIQVAPRADDTMTS
jgi:hypothetical protein